MILLLLEALIPTAGSSNLSFQSEFTWRLLSSQEILKDLITLTIDEFYLVNRDRGLSQVLLVCIERRTRMTLSALVAYA